MTEITHIYKDKSLFLSLIEKFLARKEWRIAISSDSPTTKNTQHSVRLIALMKKKTTFQLSNNFEEFQCDFTPGSLAVVLPLGYINYLPKANNHWSFQCIFWERYVRLIYGNHKTCYWYHTFSPINQSGRLCLQALSQLRQKNASEPQTKHIIQAIYHIVADQLRTDKPRNITKSMETYYAIEEYLSQNFLSLKTNRASVAKALELSPQHISRLFKEFSQDGFNTRLRKLRINHATNLLAKKELTLGEVAFKSGFASTGYFIREFRKAINVPPGIYRQNL